MKATFWYSTGLILIFISKRIRTKHLVTPCQFLIVRLAGRSFMPNNHSIYSTWIAIAQAVAYLFSTSCAIIIPKAKCLDLLWQIRLQVISFFCSSSVTPKTSFSNQLYIQNKGRLCFEFIIRQAKDIECHQVI